MQASGVLAEAGAADEATALALAVAGERPGYAHVYLIAVSLWLAAYGYLPQATRLAAEAVADAARMRGSDGKFHYNATIRELDKRAGQLKAQAITTARNAREKILDIARHAATDGADPVQTAAGRRRDARPGGSRRDCRPATVASTRSTGGCCDGPPQNTTGWYARSRT